MSKLLLQICMISIIASCTASKNYLERADADKALQDAIRKLNKNPNDENARTALPLLYPGITSTHLAKVSALSSSKEISRWDKILNEYDYLENAYDAIINSTPAFKLVNPTSYSTTILEVKQAAAEEYYKSASAFFTRPGKENAKKAYTQFKKVIAFIPDYKDANERISEAYENAIVQVIINPIQDNSFFFNNGWGNTGYNYSNEYFQATLVRELGNSGDRYPARFYTDWEARRDNIQADWVIDLRLRNINLPYPISNNYSKNVSAQVQAGSDTAGKPIYNTVYATVNVTRMSFTARADLEVSIRETATGKNISYRSFRDDYRWEQEKGSYSGDSRALSNRDWQLINNNSYYAPRKEDVLNELYRKLYPQVKDNISYAVRW